MKLGFLGGGNMAAAIIGGLLQRGYMPEDIIVAEQLAERRSWLAKEFAITVAEEAGPAVAAEIVVLAVKPQQLHAVLCCLPAPRPEQLIISIAAGVRASDISRWLHGHPGVIRAMPNTPALVGAGITGLYALPAVDAARKAEATRLLEAVGSVVWVESEAEIDAVTAISGSGPAYVFLFIEALEQAALDLGLPAETARQLTLHTFLGASALAIRDKSSPAELRARVTSKGGTTERGLLALEEGSVKYVIGLAARAAAERAHEMGDLFGKD